MVFFVDGGTTQTRVWAVRDGRVVAEARATVGARDTARDGSPARLVAALRDLVGQVGKAAGAVPAKIVAAGMITSPQGLREVPHVEAPAGAAELARGACLETLDGLPVPVLLVPGVRSGAARCDGDSVLGVDVMRGEEVLALGLAPRLAGGGVFLNLGSHWKAIRIDGAGRVVGSVSTLSGELIHATATQTILASALPPGKPVVLDPTWTDAGARAFAASGLPRALYCVRLLELRSGCTPEERQAFLYGAVMAADRAALVPAGVSRVLVVGTPALAAAWSRTLARQSIEATVVEEGEIEEAFRTGCRRVLEAWRA